jgi:hypothetical protein
MLSSNTHVKNYFEQPAIQIRPLVSAEWNYNLVYQPYVTFTGDGHNLYSPSGGWKAGIGYSQVSIDERRIYDYKETTVFKANDTTQITVTARDITSRSSFEGKATLKLANLPSDKVNCFKVVFYVKSIDNNLIGLSTQVSNDAAKVYGSSYNTIDNYDWQKVTVFVGTDATDPNSIIYNQLDLNLDFVNKTLNAVGNWGILIGHIEVYEITYFDYRYNNLWDTESPFAYFRPGESYVRSGNASILDSEVARSNGDVQAGYSNVMPCSPVVYSPRTLFSAKSNKAYKNGSLSPFSQYKYFVSERPVNSAGNQFSTSIGAAYEEVISVNKIVLKFNVSQSKPSGTLGLYAGATSIAQIVINQTDVPDSGVVVLYLNKNNVWSKSKWNWKEDSTSEMPALDYQGNITISQKMNKIVFTQSYANVSTAYASMSAEAKKEFARLQVVEISPRMELDLSSFVLDYNISKELDNKSTPLPLSSMSANSMALQLSNIPLVASGNDPLSIFSTNANDTYSTPLKNLLVKNVKFYVNYYVPANRLTTEPSPITRIIPAGVFYAETWDNQDIKTTKVQCYDVMKFLQILPVSDYVSSAQTLINIFTNIMDFAGFTDYDYNQLKSALTSNSHQLSANFFFADAKQKTVYDVLREAFLAYQVGAWVDEYGILRFLNLQSIITKNVVTYPIKDNQVVVNSYNENIKAKPGKLIMRYRLPQIKRSINLSNITNSITSVMSEAPDIIWKEDSEDLVPFYYLSKSILNFAQDDYVISKGELSDPFYTSTLDHNGYGIIEGEIISLGDKEITMSSKQANRSEPKYVSNQNDLNLKIAEFSNSIGGTDIIYSPTGRFVNVQRGLFGTPASSHIVMQNSTDFAQKLQYATLVSNSFIPGQPLSISSSGRAMVKISNGTTSYVMSNTELDKGYNTFSVKFKLPDISSKVSAGLFLGKSYYGDHYMISISSIGATTKNVKYNLDIYSVSSSGARTSLYSKDITGMILREFNNEPKVATYVQNDKGYINLKFVADSTYCIVYINGNKIITKSATAVGGSTGSQFGFFAEGASTASGNAMLSEIYACQSVLNSTINYHFQTQHYLDSIVAGKKISEKFYMMQTRPAVIGLNVYDVQLSLTPSLGAEPFKVMYSWFYRKSGAAKAPTDYIHVYDDALAYSTIVSTGFRAKFAVVNNSRFVVWTKTGPDLTKIISSQFMLLSRGVVVLTEQQTLERVLNAQNINEVVEIQSDWVQSPKSANSILGTIARASDAFSKDITLQLFGNPLIQVGDIISLDHKVKNIVGLTFFVQSVKQDFNQGLMTTLVVNQIGYVGTPGSAPKSNYSLVASSSTPTNTLGVIRSDLSNANYGSTSGGDPVIISGGSGWNSATPPQVYFDLMEASNVVVTSSTTLTCVTPPHNSGWANVTVISGGNVLTTINYDSFLFQGNTIVLDPISPYKVSDFADDSTNGATNIISIDWEVGGPLENAYNFTVDGGIKPASGNLIDESSGATNKYIGSGFVPGRTYNFTFTPVNKAYGIQYGAGVPAKLTLTCGSDNTGGGGANFAPLNINQPTISGNLTSTDFLYAAFTSTSDWINSPTVFYYQWYTNKTSNGNYAQINLANTENITLSSAYVGYNIYCAVTGVNAIGQTTVNSTVVAVTNSPTTGGGGSAPGKPITPVLQAQIDLTSQGATSDMTFYINKDLTANPPIIDYFVTLYPARNGLANETLTFMVKDLQPGQSNSLAAGITGLKNGTKYTLEVQAENSFGKSSATPRYIQPGATSALATNLNVTGNIVGSWTGDSSFSAYDVQYVSITNPNTAKSFTVSKTGTTWSHLDESKVRYTLSTDGINFVDHTYENKNIFAPGEIIDFQITPAVAGSAQNSSSLYKDSGSYYTIPDNSFTTPVGYAPTAYQQNKHQNVPAGNILPPAPGGSFYWFDEGLTPTGSYTSWVWEWEWYHQSTIGGTPSGTGTKNSNSFSIPSLKEWYVNVQSIGASTFRVRMKITGTDGNTYHGPWSNYPVGHFT